VLVIPRHLDVYVCNYAAVLTRAVLVRLDVATGIAPEALPGRDIRVYWPDNDAWFLGKVKSYDDKEHTHHVRDSSFSNCARNEDCCVQTLGPSCAMHRL